MIHICQSFSKPVCRLGNTSAHGTPNAETIPLKAMQEQTIMSNTRTAQGCRTEIGCTHTKADHAVAILLN